MNKRFGIQIVSVTILVLCFVGTASAANWTVDGSGGADFTGIQDAINNAKDGDTIIVHSCVYYENVVVDKSVTLRGIGHPVVDVGGEGDAITLSADGITLEGFNATNSGSSWRDVGIKVTSNKNTITGNNVSNNKGVGIYLEHSNNNNTITGNNVCNNREGIRLGFAGKHYVYGIRHYYSSNNNTITGNNVCSNNYDGICLGDSSNNNTITDNNVCNNNEKGIRFDDSCNNTIYFNNFINNTDNVDSSKSTNIWNSPSEMTYTYDGNTYTNYLGNYWDDYEGTDTDADGIGNTPYSIDPEEDENDDYPLMKPFENYIT